MIKLKLKTYVLGLAAALAIAIGASISPAHAAEPSAGMSVSPMKQKIVLSPGDTYTGTITVYNSSTNGASIKYKASADSFFVDDSYSVVIGMANDHTAMKDWITVNNDSGIIAQGEEVQIPFTIKVPKDAVAGGQYASIVVANVPSDTTSAGVGVQEIWQIASTIYASISGSSTQSGEIKNNNLPSLVLTPPVQASFMVENTGNVHGDAISYIQVFPIFSDEEIYTNEENPDSVIVMPGTSRFVTNTWEETPGIGLFRVRQTVKAFGASSVSEKVILICPLWLIIVVVVLVGVCIYWLVSRAVRRKKGHKGE